MSDTVEPWTIERICDALGNPTLAQRVVSEINRAPIHELTSVFARWQGIAEQTVATVAHARQLAQADRDGDLPGEWTEYTVDDLRAKAEQLRSHAA